MESSYPLRLAGISLLLSVFSILMGMIVILLRGDLNGLAAGFKGVEGIGRAASALTVMAKAGIPMSFFQLAGFGILSACLSDVGETSLSIISFGFVIVALTLSFIEGSFQASLTVWAGEQWDRRVNVSPLYEALRAWVNGSLRPVYMLAYFASMVGFSWGILRSGLLAPWVGWASLGYTALSIILYWGVIGAPAVIVLYPVFFGLGMLFL